MWTLNLLDEALAAQMRPLLAGCTTLELHGAPLQMEPLGSHSVENGLQLLLAAREEFPIVKDTTPNITTPRLYGT